MGHVSVTGIFPTCLRLYYSVTALSSSYLCAPGELGSKNSMLVCLRLLGLKYAKMIPNLFEIV